MARIDAGQTFTGTNVFAILQATSLALGGATIGSHALAVNGTSAFHATRAGVNAAGDFTNTGGRPAGAITAALFIKEFTADLPWVHIDIAGTAWAEEAKPYQPKGPTGVAMRTLVELALDAAAWSGQNLKS